MKRYLITVMARSSWPLPERPEHLRHVRQANIAVEAPNVAAALRAFDVVGEHITRYEFKGYGAIGLIRENDRLPREGVVYARWLDDWATPWTEIPATMQPSNAE